MKIKTKQEITVISDIHMGSIYAKKEKFLEILQDLKTDLLILNGDIYDLHAIKPEMDIFKIIEKNKDIKEWAYIFGNHDYEIKKYFPDLEVQEFICLANNQIKVIHGHQYDYIVSVPSTFGKYVTKARYWIEKTFNFNFKIFLEKNLGSLINWIYSLAQKKAMAENPKKILVTSHSHIAKSEYPYYNTGGLVDSASSYIKIFIYEDNSFKIVVEKV